MEGERGREREKEAIVVAEEMLAGQGVVYGNKAPFLCLES